MSECVCVHVCECVCVVVYVVCTERLAERASGYTDDCGGCHRRTTKKKGTERVQKTHRTKQEALGRMNEGCLRT